MSISVDKIGNNLPSLDIYTLRKVLISGDLTDYDKMRFIQKHKMQIHHMMEVKLSNSEFLDMMQSRPLVLFRPFKNSYTKWGDKIILSKTLDVSPSKIADYIKNVTEAMGDLNKMNNLPLDKMDTIKTYVFRHGTQSQVVTFLDYELKHSKDFLKTLHSTLEYGNGGMADYFVRPIHRMKNQTMIDLYNVVETNLNSVHNSGLITEDQKTKASEWAIMQILNIQNNSKFSNAIKHK